MNKRFGWHSGSVDCYDITVSNDMTIEGDLTFGDASTDTLTVNGEATFNTDVNMVFESGENLAITQSAMGESDKPINISAAPTESDKGARQGAIYIGMTRETVMDGADGNPDCGLKMSLSNETASEDYARLRGIDLSVETKESGSGSYSLEGASFTVKDYSGTTVNDSGHMIAVTAHFNKNGTGTADVMGILIQDDSQSDTGTHIGLKITSANYDIAKDNAILIDSADGSWANGITFDGAITNALDFADDDGTNGATYSGSHYGSLGNVDGKIQIDINGNTLYIPAYDSIAA
jgi:hypothetical protein